MLNFDPNQAPVEPRDAATVIVLRDAAVGLEVFCVRRHARSAFLGGAVVFPGGKLDDSDQAPGWAEQTTGLHPRAVELAEDAGQALPLAVCGGRETLEEAGLIAALPPLDGAAAERLRAPGNAAQSLLQRLCEAELRLDTGSLIPFAHWITPALESRRFDARFFLLRAPEGQPGRHDERETVSSLWTSPAKVLAAARAGDVFLAPPTLRCLELLCPLTSVDQAIALAGEQTLRPICPVFALPDPLTLVIPGDPLHEIPERRVAGPTRFVLRGTSFVSENP